MTEEPAPVAQPLGRHGWIAPYGPGWKDGWQNGDWHCVCGWFGNGGARGYSIHLERLLLDAARSAPDNAALRARLTELRDKSRQNGQDGWADQMDQLLALAAPTSPSGSSPVAAGLDDPECLCEGEFIWACGPECPCFHHGEKA